MSVALHPLPTSRDKSYQYFHLIPFSDYSRWERRPVKKPLHRQQHPRLLLRQQPPVQWTQGGKPKLSGPSEEGGKVKNGGSHIASNKTKLTIKAQEPPEIKLMKSEVNSRRVSLEVYRKYIKDLLQDNISIISSIMELEERTHCSTDRILERYRHFKGAMFTLKLKSEEMLAEAQEELETTRLKLHQQVEAHRAEVADVDQEIERCSRELQLLKHYKDKEFPVRQIRIEQLKETREESQTCQTEEIADIELHVTEERETFQQQLQTMKHDMEETAAEVYMAKAQAHVQKQAIQNKIMRKEIAIHKRNQKELKEAILELKRAVACMKDGGRGRGGGGRKDSSLPLIQTHIKCLPDTEIILNIPVQDHLLPV